MKTIQTILSLGVIAAFLLAGCAPAGQSPSPTEPQEPTQPEQPTEPATGAQDLVGEVAYNPNPQAGLDQIRALANAHNAFALDLYKQLAAEGENVFYSPYSIYMALLMTYAGAAGDTASQMESTLHLPYSQEEIHAVMNALDQRLKANSMVDDEPAFTLNIVNQLWGQAGYAFLPEFLNTLSQNYNAGLKTVDFISETEATRQLINLWVEAQTNEKIKDLIPEGALNELTRLVITNAVYFKAAWLYQFDAANTKAGNFTLLDGTQVEVPMMHQSATLRAYISQEVQAVELPYEGGTYSMVALMPTAGSLDAFEQSLTAESLQGILNQLDRASVTLSMPKFKFDAAFTLNDPLEAMGMTDAFNFRRADFSRMDGTTDLYITSALHKAYVDVNEEGTEAAAATAVIIGLESAVGQSYTIKLDHPFLFLIRDNATGTMLFVGRMADPR
jgi:serpin B